MQGGLKYYALDVPAGQSKVVFKISGGSGDCDIYGKRTAQPTTSVYDYRPYTTTNNETITVNSPTAGTWHIMLRGYAAYSGVTLVATYSAGSSRKPDLTVWMASANPRFETRTFGSNDCAVGEGSIAAGTRRLLRFSTETRNSGTDLVIGAPGSHPELFEYDACHGHYHFHGWAQYNLRDGAGQLVAGGRKIGFCIEDFNKVDSGAGPAKFDCNYQGLSTGWGDTYSSTLEGQWIDITNIPSGTYTLEIVVDPDLHFDETNESNNVGTMSVTIPPVSSGATSLQNDVPVSSLSGTKGSLKYYKITVPTGATQLQITTSGGSGDVDLYAKFGAQPSTGTFDYRSWTYTTSEIVTVSAPRAGDWYITLHGYAAYSGVTLLATVTGAAL